MNNDNFITQRKYEWIDIAKGFGIILVILGHCIRDGMQEKYIFSVIYTFIYTFHMPLFFLLSGFLFENSIQKENGVKKFIEKKTNTLFIPFITYTLLIYLALRIGNGIPFVRNVLMSKGDGYQVLIPYLLECLNGNNSYAFHLWYLLVLYIVQVMNICISALLGKINDCYRVVFLFLLGMVAYYFGMIIYPPGASVNSMTLNTFLKSSVFFAFGQIMYYFGNKIIGSHIFVIAETVVSGGLLLLYSTGNLSVVEAVIGYNWNIVLLLLIKIVFLTGITGCCAMHRKSEVLKKLGRESYKIYLLHQPVCCAFLGTLLYDKMHIYSICVIGICFIASIVIPLVSVKILKMNKICRKILHHLLNL